MRNSFEGSFQFGSLDFNFDGSVCYGVWSIYGVESGVCIRWLDGATERLCLRSRGRYVG